MKNVSTTILQLHAYLWKYTSESNIPQLLQMLYPINPIWGLQINSFSVTGYIVTGNHRLQKKNSEVF